MIPTPVGWRRVDVGEDVLLLPADGASLVRYRERLGPVLPIDVLVAAQLADDPQFVVERVEPRVDLVTIEGERGATVAVHGVLDGRRVQRHFAYVIAEDFYARISSLADDSEGDGMRVLVRELVEHVRLRLGPRRRRAVYAGPPGWRAHTVGLRTDWITEAFPHDPSCLTVWPAVPGPPSSAAPPVANIEGTLGPWPVHTKQGLRGFTWRTDGTFADGTTRRRDFIFLADGRYRFALRLETDLAHHEQHRAELLHVIDSLNPVPLEKQSPDVVSVSGHWAE